MLLTLLQTPSLLQSGAASRAQAELCIAMLPHRVEQADRPKFEQSCLADCATLGASKARGMLLLHRRNDVEMYGKRFDTYPANTPDVAVMQTFEGHTEAAALSWTPAGSSSTPLSDAPLLWDATLVVRPTKPPTFVKGEPCFLAMNRFPVRPSDALLFEERWASRTSALAAQPDFLGFSLLRRRGPLSDGEEPHTYSTATLWASEVAWSRWREGEGKNAHAASSRTQRTPVSEWMEGSASPIFWDVPILVHHSGVEHICLTGGGSWDSMYALLVRYRSRWGNADAPKGPSADGELGNWCAVQRRLYAEGKLSETRVDALNALGLSWVAPSDVDDPLAHHDWGAMCERLVSYRDAHGGSCDVPKKWRPDPTLGGWVAAVRRCRDTLADELLTELDSIGFAWSGENKCGSKFMRSFRELRAFWEQHGHCRVAEVLGPEHDIALFCDATHAAVRDGTLSPKRLRHLEAIEFE